MYKAEELDGLVASIAKGTFVLGALIFALMAFHPVQDIPHGIRHAGVGMTIFASFIGAYDFATTNSRYVDRWLLGCNLTILIVTMLLCTLAISRDEIFVHNVFVQTSLFLYVVWDLIAFDYFRRKSRVAANSYVTILKFDFILFIVYSLAYIPVDSFVNPTVAEVMFRTHTEHAFSDLIAGAILIAEFVGFMVYSPKFDLGNVTGERLSVAEGYTNVASFYDRGNAIMYVEQRHTEVRLRQLDITGVIVDLGCGSGRYINTLLENASKVIAIDSSEEMIRELQKKLYHQNWQNIEIQINEADLGLRKLDENSIDGVFCTLLIDHIPRPRLQDILSSVYRVLRPGGWLYITDVNPYFATRTHPFAEFIDPVGNVVKIIVYPHPISVVKEQFEVAGFNNWELREILVRPDDSENFDGLEDLVGQPIIFEYFATK